MQYRMAWPPFTRNIKIALVAMVVLWIVRVQFTGFVDEYLIISQRALYEQSFPYVWTIFTHALFHADFPHMMFNGLVLWMFGGDVDQRWDDTWFWGFCAICAVGGGLAVALFHYLFGGQTLGFSGAIMGIVAAYSWGHWNRPLRLFGVVEIKGKWLLPIFVAADLLMVVGAGRPISIAGHLGGMITGLLLVTGYWRPGKLKIAWKRWKAKRDTAKDVRRPNDRRWN